MAENKVTEQSAPALEWGKMHEATAIAEYTMETGRDVKPAPFVNLDGWPIGASPDGLVGDDGLIEVKCPYSMGGFSRYVSDGYESAKDQVQGQMWITGRAWCDFVAYDPRNAEFRQLHVVRVERHEPYIAELQRKVFAFAQHIIDGTDPEGSKFHDPMSDQPINLF